MRIDRMQTDYWKSEVTASYSNGNGETPHAGAAVESGPVKTNSDQTMGAKRSDDDKINVKTAQEAIEKINKTADAFNKQIHLKIHEATGRVMVQIVNRETNETLMELPPEKILDMVAKIEKEMGLILDKRV